MGGRERRQVDVGERVPGEHDEDVVVARGEEVGDVADAAGGAEQLLLALVGDLDPERRAVAEPPLDLLREPVEVRDDLVDAVGAEQPHELLDDRDVADRDDRLGDRVGYRPQSRAEARCHDHRAHRGR